MSLEDTIIVVSGLPRSGTSLMMQMLDWAGIPILTDTIRTADADNPHGYYEFEPVKKTKQDPSWITAARGKAVKMVSPLLYDLPATETYRVLFMRRNIDEMLDSQEKMLQRLGRPAALREAIKSAFDIHLRRLFDWIPQQDHLHLLEVNYNELLRDSVSMTAIVVRFLENVPPESRMREAIDPTLYRNRSAS